MIMSDLVARLRKLASELSVSVDSVPFGKAGVRVVLEGYLGLPSFGLLTEAADRIEWLEGASFIICLVVLIKLWGQ